MKAAWERDCGAVKGGYARKNLMPSGGLWLGAGARTVDFCPKKAKKPAKKP